MTEPDELSVATDERLLEDAHADPEAPENDVLEQSIVVDEDAESEPPPRIDAEVNEADAIEQSRVVRVDEEDYP